MAGMALEGAGVFGNTDSWPGMDSELGSHRALQPGPGGQPEPLWTSDVITSQEATEPRAGRQLNTALHGHLGLTDPSTRPRVRHSHMGSPVSGPPSSLHTCECDPLGGFFMLTSSTQIQIRNTHPRSPLPILRSTTLECCLLLSLP